MEISNEQEFQSWNAMTEKNRRIVLDTLDAMNKGDGEDWLDAFHEDFEFTIPGNDSLSGTKKGMKAFRELIENVGERLEVTISIKLTNVIASGEWVVTESLGHSVTKAGDDYNQTYCILFQVRDGKIIKYVEYHDTALIRKVLLNE
jgi:ketosteroid isomerase-like protein